MGFFIRESIGQKTAKKNGEGGFQKAGREGRAFSLERLLAFEDLIRPAGDGCCNVFIGGKPSPLPAPRTGAGHLWPGLCDGGTVRNPFVGVQEDHVAFLRDPSQHEDFRFKTGDPPGREIDDGDDLAPDQPFRGVPAGDLRR